MNTMIAIRTAFRSVVAAPVWARRFLAVAGTSVALAGCAPSASEVCDHVLDVEKSDGAKSMGRPACEMKVGFQKEKLGLIKWRSYSSCVTDAKDMASIEKCGASPN
jgi:hypothetical protein